MPPGKRQKSQDLSVEEMRQWLATEVRNVIKEADLRVKDATEFTTAYTLGKLTPKQAMARLSRYDGRWREPLYGVAAADFKTDEELVAKIDEAHAREAKRWTQIALRERSEYTR